MLQFDSTKAMSVAADGMQSDAAFGLGFVQNELIVDADRAKNACLMATSPVFKSHCIDTTEAAVK